MYLDDRLLRQLHQERVQAAEQERLAMAAHRDGRAMLGRATRTMDRGLLAILLRWVRPVVRLRDA